MDVSTKIILDLIKQHGITKAQLEKDCGLSNGTIGKWEKGSYNPSREALDKIADYFNVSADYLLNKTDIPISSQNKGSYNELTHSDKVNDLVKLTLSLSDEDAIKVFEYAEFLKQKRSE